MVQTFFIFMSVVLYRNDGKTKTLAADSLCVKGDVVYSSPDKLLKLNDNQFVGGVGSADFSEYVKICLKDALQKDETVITLRKKIADIVKEYGKTADAELLIATFGKVYYVSVDNGELGCCLDITDMDIYGIGYSEMAMGAVLAGLGLKEAIELVSDREHSISKPAYEYIIE